MGFQLKLLEKAYFIVKMTGLAMVRLASSDFWKALQDIMWTHDLNHLEFNGFKQGSSLMSNQMIWFGEWKVWHLNQIENTFTAWRSASYIWSVPPQSSPLITHCEWVLSMVVIAIYWRFYTLFKHFFKDSQRNCQ